MTIRCPTCYGAGCVPRAFPPGTVLCIHPWPTELCLTCCGTGWVAPPAPYPAITITAPLSLTPVRRAATCGAAGGGG